MIIWVTLKSESQLVMGMFLCALLRYQQKPFFISFFLNMPQSIFPT